MTNGFILGVVLALSASACTSSGKCAPDVLWRGTEAYESALMKFELSPEDAKQAIIAYERNQRATASTRSSTIFVGEHYVVWKNDYVFSLPNKQGVSLSGHYVNGFSGEVRFQEGPLIQGSFPRSESGSWVK